MNHKLLIFIAGGALAACTATAATDTYTVSAEFSEDFDGQPAVMINYDTGEKIDSVLVEGNKAVFSGSVEKPVMARIIIDGNRVPVFVLEPGAITISPEVRGASGSALNDLNAKIQQHIGELGAKYQAAPQDSTGDAERERIMAAYDSYCDSVFKANVDNPIGYTLFMDKAYNMTLPELEAALVEYPSLKTYTRVNKLIAAAKNKAATSPGSKFVDFAITNDSITQRLSDYVGKGKPVLVDFWASWCGPCIRETKVIKEILEEYGPKGLEVLGVAVWDEPQNTLRAIEHHKLPWQQIINAQTVPTDLYGISGIPCILLIAPDGTILSRDKQDEELRADVKAMMEGSLTPETVGK